MRLEEHLSAIEASGKAFDLTARRAEILTESVYRSLDIAKDEAKVHSLEYLLEESEQEALIHQVVLESAEKVSDILTKTREAYNAYNEDINNTINTKILNEQNKALFKKIEEKTKKNPSLRNKKVEVNDAAKEIEIILAAITDLDKIITKMRSGGDLKELEQELDHVHIQCQKDRKKVGKVEMTASQIIDSIQVPSKIGKDILSYEKNIEKYANSDDEKDQEKARVMLKGHLDVVKMAKEVRSVELHASLDRLRKLRTIFSSEDTKEVKESVMTEAVVNDKKIAKINNDVSAAIVTIKTYIKVAKSIMRNPALKGVTPAELKGFIKEAEAVISDLRSNRQKLRDAVKKAKLGEHNLKEKIFGDEEVRSAIGTLKGTFANVSSLKKRMNKYSRQNRKIIRNVKTIEAVRPQTNPVAESADDEYLRQFVSDLFAE